MKTKIKLLLASITCLVIYSCKKKDVAPRPIVMVDVDNNTYSTVKIGNKIWTTENLRVTRYKNGDSIQPKNKDNNINKTDWIALTTGAWCNYDNNVANEPTYGKLYNKLAVISTKGLAPEGWHIATVADWDDLISNVPNSGDLKALTSWTGDTTRTNKSGFNAIAVGCRDFNGNFVYLNQVSRFWAASGAYYYDLFTNTILQKRAIELGVGYAVRCVKD